MTTTKAQFTRQPNGGWRFETSDGRTFEARRLNSGRDWECYEITWAPVADGKYHEMVERISGVWSFRPEIVAELERRIVRAEAATKQHTIGGQPISESNPGAYGRTHDYDCPACQGTSFTASPRSETYWCS